MLVLAVASWGLLGAFQNINHWQGTLGAITAATSMVTFEGGAEKWQATSSPIIVWMGALFIVMSKLSAGVFCIIGASKMWLNRNNNEQTFKRAKQIAIIGCGIALFMLFFGFVVIAETWFELWRSDAMRGPVLDSAMRYAGLIGLIALFVNMKDE